MIFLLGINSRGQILQRQIISAHGLSSFTKSGLYVNQTLGQSISTQSLAKSSLIIQQGFQQSLFSVSDFGTINTNQLFDAKVYPSPFSSFLNVEILTDVSGEVEFILMDNLGRSVVNRTIQPLQNSFTMNGLDFLPSGIYFIRLKNNNYIYSNKIIKL